MGAYFASLLFANYCQYHDTPGFNINLTDLSVSVCWAAERPQITSDLKIQLHVDTSIPHPQATFALVGTVSFIKAKNVRLYLLVDPEYIRCIGFEANANPPVPSMHSLPARPSLSLCFNMVRPPALAGPYIAPLVPRGKEFGVLFYDMIALSTVDKFTIYFDPVTVGAEVQAQFALLLSLFSSALRPAPSDSYNLRRLYCGQGGWLMQLRTTVGRLSSTTIQDYVLHCSPAVDDQGSELAGGYPDNNLDSL
ncbi:hypothetical protein QBC32DRAFT_146476 [Pseudoneurospora amorphoporcata]|uniref:Uncharacterized protein n=1 Tax=Pseudoneurospora amorphoporcata TaxID=241081 RepID=A0AAN6SG28_9PEZI|nr:hypothetical protein QBC32DRAFT_146476 [Pseudoneurospora amorphoporcata]